MMLVSGIEPVKQLKPCCSTTTTCGLLPPCTTNTRLAKSDSMTFGVQSGDTTPDKRQLASCACATQPTGRRRLWRSDACLSPPRRLTRFQALQRPTKSPYSVKHCSSSIRFFLYSSQGSGEPTYMPMALCMTTAGSRSSCSPRRKTLLVVHHHCCCVYESSGSFVEPS